MIQEEKEPTEELPQRFWWTSSKFEASQEINANQIGLFIIYNLTDQMRKLKQLRKKGHENKQEEGPFEVLHHFRLIYKSKRRSMLRKMKIAKGKFYEQSDLQSSTDTNQNTIVPVNVKEQSLWDVLVQFPKLQKEESEELPTFLHNDLSMENQVDEVYDCQKPQEQNLTFFEVDNAHEIQLSFFGMENIF